MTQWRVLERKLRDKVNTDGTQFGFMPGKAMTDAIFVVQQCRKNSMCISGSGESFGRTPREVVRWALRKLEVEEWLVKAVLTVYEKARTVVRTMQREL